MLVNADIPIKHDQTSTSSSSASLSLESSSSVASLALRSLSASVWKQRRKILKNSIKAYFQQYDLCKKKALQHHHTKDTIFSTHETALEDAIHLNIQIL